MTTVELTQDIASGPEPSKYQPFTSNLIAHAMRELDLCGQAAEDPAYAQSIVCAVAAFAAYGGHSGGSAAVAIEQLTRLLRFEALSPLTDDPTEWADESERSGEPWWQNRRDPRAMSHDGGKTYWLVEEPQDAAGRRVMHQSQSEKS